MDDLIKQGATAFKAGDLERARKILAEAIKQFPDDERAWGWMYNACDNDEERIHCLKQMVRINPNNEKANRLLIELMNSDLPLKNPYSPVTKKKNRSKPEILSGFQKRLILGTTSIIFFIFVAIFGVMNSFNFIFSIFGPCNNEVLRKTLDIKLGPNMTIETLSRLPLLGSNAKENTISWKIYQRNRYGCVIELSGEVNGIRGVGAAWFIDLQQKKVYPDDKYTKAMISGIVSQSGDRSLISGIPFP